MAIDSTPHTWPSWPAADGDPSAADRPSGGPRDGRLVAGGVVYLVAGFMLLLFGGGRWGPVGLAPEAILLPAVVTIGVAVGAKLRGVSLRWASVAAFVGWVAVVTLAELWVWSEAIAAV